MHPEVHGMSPVLPTRDPRDATLVNTSVTIPEWIRDRIGEMANQKGYSRSELLTHLLKFALAHQDAADSRSGASLFEALVNANEAAQAALEAYERDRKSKK